MPHKYCHDAFRGSPDQPVLFGRWGRGDNKPSGRTILRIAFFLTNMFLEQHNYDHRSQRGVIFYEARSPLVKIATRGGAESLKKQLIQQTPNNLHPLSKPSTYICSATHFLSERFFLQPPNLQLQPPLYTQHFPALHTCAVFLIADYPSARKIQKKQY